MPEAVTLRLAGYQSDPSILTASLRQVAQGLEAAGPFAVSFDPDVTRGGEKAVQLFASVEDGTRQVAYMASSYLAARVPELAVLDIPFSVADRSSAWAALDGAAGAMLREAVARRTGFHVLGFWDNGFRHVSNALRPIRTPADCTGISIRTLDSQHYRDLLAALGFKPVTIDVKDLVNAVATRAVDAQENPLTNLLGFKLWQHHPHLSLTGHFYGVALVVCPRSWYEALPAPTRSALDQAVAGASPYQRQLAAEEDIGALQAVRSHGVQVLEAADLDLAAFRRAAEPLARRMRDALPPALVQAYLSPASHPS